MHGLEGTGNEIPVHRDSNLKLIYTQIYKFIYIYIYIYIYSKIDFVITLTVPICQYFHSYQHLKQPA